MRVVKVLIAVLALFLSSGLALASGKSTSSNYVLPLSAPKILGLTLLKSSFQDAEKLLGAAHRFRSSRATGAADKVCYASPVGNRNVRLILVSNYTGGWEDLSGFTLTTLPTKPHGGKCTKTNRFSYKTKVLDGHVHLGMSKRDVLKSLGEPRIRDLGHWGNKGWPKVKTAHTWFYIDTWKQPVYVGKSKTATPDSNSSKTQEFDAWKSVERTFKEGKLVQIDVGYGLSD